MPLSSPGAGAPVTLHARIAAWLRSQIASGTWPAHFRLKPEPELARELGVSRGTLRKALRTLTDEGALVQIRGKGTYVTSPVVEPALAQKLTSLSEDFAAQGIPLTTEVLRARLTTPRPAVRALLDVTDGRIVELVRLRSTTEGPVALLANYVRADLAPGLETADFATATLFGTMAEQHDLHVASARRTFSATAAEAEQARALEVDAGSPLLYLEQVSYLPDGTPVEYSDVWIRSDRLRVTSLLKR